MNCHGVPTENNREKTLRRQTTFARHHTSSPSVKNSFLIWVTCFFRQFGPSVARTDYLTLRKGFIMNHNLSLKYDFHSYMIRSMEEEFQRVVGVSVPLWGFVVAVMLFNVKGMAMRVKNNAINCFVLHLPLANNIRISVSINKTLINETLKFMANSP
ncbi:MLO-like protein 11 [Populus alba]